MLNQVWINFDTLFESALSLRQIVGISLIDEVIPTLKHFMEKNSEASVFGQFCPDYHIVSLIAHIGLFELCHVSLLRLVTVPNPDNAGLISDWHLAIKACHTGILL